jgi:hypothetical protein
MARHVLAVVAALLVMLGSAPALAKKDGDGGPKHHAPEFDVAAVGAVAAIIGGGGILLARRRRR